MRFFSSVMKTFGGLLVILAICKIGLAEEMQLPLVVHEDFSDEAAYRNLNMSRNSWRIAGGELQTVSNNRYSLEFAFGEEDWNDYEITFKVRRLRVPQGDQHFGLFVRDSKAGSVRLYCRGNSLTYIADSRHETLGTLKNPLSAGTDSPWSYFRILVSGTTVTAFVDGAQVGASIGNVIPAAGKIKFYAFNLDIALDDLKVTVTRAGAKNVISNATSRNILHNSSFEQCTLDGLPDYWGSSHWGLANPYWAVHFEEWQTRFLTDSTQACDGQRSLKMVNPAEADRSLNLWSVCVRPRMNERYTLSAYLKSEPSGLKIKFGSVQGHKETFTLTDKWQRYNTTFIKDKNDLYAEMVCAIPQGKGTFWVDAVQLEEGELSDYQPMKNEKQQLQAEEGNVNKVLTEVPQSKPPYVRQSLTLDGKLDDEVWAKAPLLKFVSSSGASLKEPTFARVWYNDRGIYIGIKCADQNAGENECKVKSRDGNVWNDPSLELFVDPQLSRNYYYHLALNQAGTQYDGFCGDMSWNGKWQARTYTNAAGNYWSAEIFLPFGELGIDPTAGNWWGFNLCRENHHLQEFGSWSPTYGSFHTPTRFGQIDVDRKIQTMYYVGCSEAKLQRLAADLTVLSVDLYNKTDRDRVYQAEGRVLDQEGVQVAKFSRGVTLGQGEESSLELGEIPWRDGVRYSLELELKDSGQGYLAFSGTRDLELPDSFSLLTQYDVYTSEKQVTALVKSNLGEKLLQDGKLNLELYNIEGQKISQRSLDGLKLEMIESLDLAGLPDGDYELRAQLSSSGGNFTARKAFRKVPPKPHEIKVDHFSRMVLVDGKPFFPKGLILEGNNTPECVKYYKDNGANCLSFFIRMEGGSDYAKMADLLACASENDVKLMIQLSSPTQESRKKLVWEFIQKFQDSPAVLAWFVYDEAFTMEWGKNHYPEIVQCLQECQRKDPYHLAMANENSYGLSFLKNNKLDFPGEVVSIDHYVFPPSGSLQLVSTYAKDMVKEADKAAKPCWMYLFGGGYTFWASRDLNAAEQEFETYTAIINGVRGIQYLADHPRANSNWQKIKELFAEIDELTPILASTAAAPSLKCNTSAIEYLVKKTETGTYIIAANTTSADVKARFDLSNLTATSGKVLFEDRNLPVVQGILTDTFKGLQRHVYFLK